MLTFENYYRTKANKSTGRMSKCKDCIRDYQTEYKKTDQYKKTYSNWWKSRGLELQKEKQNRARNTPEGKERRRKQSQSAKYKQANKRYTSSPKGRATSKAAYARRMTDPE